MILHILGTLKSSNLRKMNRKMVLGAGEYEK
jgi:hypothetical protein